MISPTANIYRSSSPGSFYFGQLFPDNLSRGRHILQNIAKTIKYIASQNFGRIGLL